MANRRHGETDGGFTDTELAMLGEFSDSVRAGGKPDIDEFLKRCPGSKAKMRPILEKALLLGRLSEDRLTGHRQAKPARMRTRRRRQLLKRR